MATDSITISEVATAVRFAFYLWAGKVGPKEFGNGLGNYLVRDMDFFVSLAKEIKEEGLDLFAEHKARTEEELKRRKLRSNCVEIAEEILAVVSHLRKHDHRWPLFENCVNKQTPRAVARRQKDRAEWSVLDDLAAVAGIIENRVGPEKIETMLTFRRLLA